MDWFKKQKLSNWIIGILILFNVITLISLWAVRLHRPAELPPEEAQHERRILNFLRGELDLNETQAAGFKKMRYGHFERFRNISSRITDLRHGIMESVFTDPPDTVHIKQLAEQLGRLHADKEFRNAEHFLRLRQICTPEQKKKFNKLMHNLLPGTPQRGRRSSRERGGHFERGGQNSPRRGRGYQNRQNRMDSSITSDNTVKR